MGNTCGPIMAISVPASPQDALPIGVVQLYSGGARVRSASVRTRCVCRIMRRIASWLLRVLPMGDRPRGAQTAEERALQKFSKWDNHADLS